METAVRFDGVTKTYSRRRAIDQLSFTIPEGSLYGFIGPNGSGKTTTLRIMLGILYADAGNLCVLGREHPQSVDDRTGYLPEERGLYRRMRVADVLEFHARLNGMRRPRANVANWLERLDLSDRANERVGSLSKGLAQKVQFAAAVVHQPRLLVLDEPFSGLDPVSTEGMRELIMELKQAGTTVILSTHDMSMAERICDAVLMLHRGRKVLDGPIERLQHERGYLAVRVTFSEALPALSDPSVTRTRCYGRDQVLELVAGADPQQLLARLLKRGRILSFSIARPSLHELFVEIAGDPKEPDAQSTG